MADVAYVFMDLETTDLPLDTSEIIQIAAKCKHSPGTEFCRYVVPTAQVHPAASKKTGFKKDGDKLLHWHKEMVTVPLEQALGDFLQFLRKTDKDVVLIGHNAWKFDAPLLLRDMHVHGLLDSFREIVTGVVDTLRVFGLKLEDVALQCGVNVDNAHCALVDVRILSQIIKVSRKTEKDLSKFQKSLPLVILGDDGLYSSPPFTTRWRCGLNPIASAVRFDLLKRMAHNFVTLEIARLAAGDKAKFEELFDFLDDTPKKDADVSRVREAVLRVRF